MTSTTPGKPFAEQRPQVVDSVVTLCNDWRIHTLERVDSTNLVAAGLPPWTAVRADSQTAGRGRTGRPWVSDRGGLWVSAVLPCPANDEVWKFLPLAIGWALAHALRGIGVDGLRLRWPNDLMVGSRKLAGILVERFCWDTAVAGVGINIFNTPESSDPNLAGGTARLVDLVSAVGPIEAITVQLLAAIRKGHETLGTQGFSAISADLNTQWTEPRQVELSLTGRREGVRGKFAGINEKGSLRLRLASGEEATFEAEQVALLRELE